MFATRKKKEESTGTSKGSFLAIEKPRIALSKLIVKASDSISWKAVRAHSPNSSNFYAREQASQSAWITSYFHVFRNRIRNRQARLIANRRMFREMHDFSSRAFFSFFFVYSFSLLVFTYSYYGRLSLPRSLQSCIRR